MNTKILVSLLVIGLTAIAIGGAAYTGAFFSDTETSTGNTFAAGTLDLEIDSNCTYNGETVADCTWAKKDLSSEKLFNYNNLLPGDSGSSSISFHVSNDAWACMKVASVVDNGALDENLNLTVWVDANCNNVRDSGENTFVNNIPVSTFTSSMGSGGLIHIADSTGGLIGQNNYLTSAGSPYCIGIEWILNPGYTEQGKSITADLEFDIVQHANNADYVCQ